VLKVDKDMNKRTDVRFQVLTAAGMKITAFWDIAHCNLVVVDRRFRGAYCLHYQLMETVRTSETSVFNKETTRRYIPEGYNLQEDG
jgi:hypothetical protein